MHTLVKIKTLKPKGNLIKVGNSFLGLVYKKTLKIGESLYIENASSYRTTSIITEITNHPIDKGVQVIRTLNSIYHLIPFLTPKKLIK